MSNKYVVEEENKGITGESRTFKGFGVQSKYRRLVNLAERGCDNKRPGKIPKTHERMLHEWTENLEMGRR